MATIEETIEIFRNIAPHVETWVLGNEMIKVDNSDPDHPKKYRIPPTRVWFVKNPDNPNDIGLEIHFLDGGEKAVKSFEDIKGWQEWRSQILRNHPDEYCIPMTEEWTKNHLDWTTEVGMPPLWEQYEAKLQEKRQAGEL